MGLRIHAHVSPTTQTGERVGLGVDDSSNTEQPGRIGQSQTGDGWSGVLSGRLLLYVIIIGRWSNGSKLEHDYEWGG